MPLEPSRVPLQAARGGGPKGIQKRIIQEGKDKYGELPPDELREKMRDEFKMAMAEDALARSGGGAGTTSTLPWTDSAAASRVGRPAA